ncbi:MAG: DUF5615 family PIN-like protein [Methylococcales bacterium]|nr:DUF5615 family PIN-like protein [Methylococcales bacterium]
MKLLLDENLSRRIVPFILGCYPESTQIALIGLENTDDKVIRAYAIDNGYVIVTQDADFYDMNMIYGQPPKLIWLKTGNQSKAATIKTLLDNHQIIEQSLVAEDLDCIEII